MNEFTIEFRALRCTHCNENGLEPCPKCTLKEEGEEEQKKEEQKEKEEEKEKQMAKQEKQTKKREKKEEEEREEKEEEKEREETEVEKEQEDKQKQKEEGDQGMTAKWEHDVVVEQVQQTKIDTEEEEQIGMMDIREEFEEERFEEQWKNEVEDQGKMDREGKDQGKKEQEAVEDT